MIGESPAPTGRGEAASASPASSPAPLSGDIDAAAAGPSASAANTRSKMRMKNSSNNNNSRRSSSNPNANYLPGAESDGDGEETGDLENPGEYPLVEDEVETLLRKLPRRRVQLSESDHQVVRLIGQHLTNIGLKASANVLMHEAGVSLDQPAAANFRKFVMSGQWSKAVKGRTIRHPFF